MRVRRVPNPTCQQKDGCWNGVGRVRDAGVREKGWGEGEECSSLGRSAV